MRPWSCGGRPREISRRRRRSSERRSGRSTSSGTSSRRLHRRKRSARSTGICSVTTRALPGRRGGRPRGLYASRGLIPVAPNLHLGGEARAEDPGLEPVEPEPSVVAALDRAGYGFDRAGYGFDRALDHAYWQQVGRCTVWLRSGDAYAYSYAYPWDTIGPIAAIDGPAAADAFRAEVARSEGSVSLVVPGTSRELVAAALEAGLRFTRPPGLLLLGPGIEPPRALAISGYSLF